MNQYELARDLSLRCQLNLDAVWVSWGLQCLRDRKWTDGREMFRMAFAGSGVSPSPSSSPSPSPSASPLDSNSPAGQPRSRSISVGSSNSSGRPPPISPLSMAATSASSMTSPVSRAHSVGLRRAASVAARTLDPQRIVEQVIQLLDPSTSSSSSSAPATPTQAPSPVSAQGGSTAVPHASTPAVSVPIDPEALGECIFYLENYGARRSLVAFHMRHHMLEAAIAAVFKYSVDTDIFVQEIIQPCMAHTGLQDLKSLIKKLGMKWLVILVRFVVC